MERVLAEGVLVLEDSLGADRNEAHLPDPETYRALSERYRVAAVLGHVVEYGTAGTESVLQRVHRFAGRGVPAVGWWAAARALRGGGGRGEWEAMVNALRDRMCELAPRVGGAWLQRFAAAALDGDSAKVGEAVHDARQLNAALAATDDAAFVQGEEPHLFIRHGVSVEFFLLYAAFIRSSQRMQRDASVLVDGVVLHPSHVSREAGDFAAKAAPAVLAEEESTAQASYAYGVPLTPLPPLPLTSASAPQPAVPSLFLRRAKLLSGLVLPTGSVKDLQAFYMKAYSFCASVYSSGALLPFLPEGVVVASSCTQPEWRKCMWEVGQGQQLQMVLELLRKEAFSVPFEVFEAPQRIDESAYTNRPYLPRGTQVTYSSLRSPFAVEAHGFLVELREDAAAALTNRSVPAAPQDDSSTSSDDAHFKADVAGQWRAAREVLLVVFCMTSVFLGNLLNAFHSRTERFAYGERRVWPYILSLSDVLSLLAVHFESPMIDMMVCRKATVPEDGDPPRLDCRVLTEVACCPPGPHLPGNLLTCVSKLSVLAGLGLDKVRGFIASTTQKVGQVYCSREDPLVPRAEPSVDEGEPWTNRWSRSLENLLCELIFPLGNLGQRIAPELALSLLSHAVTSVVEDLVEAVRVHVVRSPSTPVPASAFTTWDVSSSFSPSILEDMHPMLPVLFADLNHLAAYLHEHLQDFSLLDLPCWLMPSSIVYQLSEQQAESTD